MKRFVIACAFALAACGQAVEEKAAEPAAAPDKSNLQAYAAAADQLGVAGLVMEAVRAAPEAVGGCATVKRIEDMGLAPAGLAAPLDAIAGARAFSIDCGTAKNDDETFAGVGQYMVVLPAGPAAQVIPCVTPANPANICWTSFSAREIVPAATPTAAKN